MLAIKHPDSVLDSGMNEWSAEQHARSGLKERCRESSVGMAVAEERVLEFVAKHVEPGQGLIAGNSVHVDLAFLRKVGGRTGGGVLRLSSSLPVWRPDLYPLAPSPSSLSSHRPGHAPLGRLPTLPHYRRVVGEGARCEVVPKRGAAGAQEGGDAHSPRRHSRITRRAPVLEEGSFQTILIIIIVKNYRRMI